MAERRRGELVFINADGTAARIIFWLNPSSMQLNSQVVWNFLESQGEYFAAASFGRIGSGRGITMELFLHWAAKFDILGADQFNREKGLQLELDLLRALTEPDTTDSQFNASLQRGEILRGVAPPRVMLDYGITLHNDEGRRPPVEVAFTTTAINIEGWNHRGWPINIRSSLQMTPVLTDEAAVEYYRNLQTAVQSVST